MKKFLLACVFCLNVFATPNSIIALVNDDIITFDAIANDIKPEQSKEQKLALVEEQIDLALKRQQIKQIGIEAKSGAINNALNNVAIQNQLTLKQLKQLPEFNQMVEQIKQQLVLRGLRQFVLKEVDFSLTADEIASIEDKSQQQDEQVKIAQILINSIDDTGTLGRSQDQLIEEFLLELSRQINNGESFSALAKLHSQDPSYRNGGESGWIDVKKLPIAFRQHLRLGKLSKPFKTAQGWRIIKTIDSRQINNNFIAAKAQLIRTKQDAYYDRRLASLKEDAYIEIFDHKL